LTLLTRFTDPHAVDLWDSRFRWRSGNRLRDRTVDETWRRVAEALAEPEGDGGVYWRSRYAFAFGNWQILPDARLLRHAGTDMPVPLLCEPRAVVNAGVFVADAHTRQARFDHKRFGAAAALAVRMLDDAAMAYGPGGERPLRLAIGMIGLGDALDRLGLAYASGRAPAVAQAIARSLAFGCLHGALQLAEERGSPEGSADAGLAALWLQRGLPASLADAVARSRRHQCLTRIDAQPELARLANGASDALAPARTSVETVLECDAWRMQVAVRAIRAAVQPWIDAPIGVPKSSGEAVAADT